MFRGLSTQDVYERCLKRGLCKEHAKGLNQSERAAQNNDLPRKVLLFIRTGILDPILFKKSGKCEKIKFLLQKTSYFSHCFEDKNVPDEAYDSIFTLDSVAVFTLCHLSKICCIGALFQLKNKKKSKDPEIMFLQNLLHTDRLTETDISHLNPLMQENFEGFDTDLIKVCYASTLLFVRYVCVKLNMKTAIEIVEQEIFSQIDLEETKAVAEADYEQEKYEEALIVYTAALNQNSYCVDFLTRRAQIYVKLRQYKAAQLDGYIATIINPLCCDGYCKLSSSLFHQKFYKQALDVAVYGLSVCNSIDSSSYEALESIKIESEMKYLNVGNKELCNNISKVCIKHHTDENNLPEDVDNFPDLIEASDSGESDSEYPVLIEGSDSESETVEEKVVNTPSKSKKPNSLRKRRTISENHTDVKAEEQIDMVKINSVLKEASEALLEDCGYKAIQLFRGPLRHFIESPMLQSLEESDVVCIKYGYGLAYCKSGGYDDLQKCIVIFKDIIEKHESIIFPAAYYALGLAYRKLNRFKEALSYLEPVQNILDKGIHCKVYPWPGMTAVIKESKSEILKSLVEELIKECENPPNYDAFCRYPECSFQPIYYTDPDFKGYISLACSDQCCLQYHLQCWKVLKTTKNLNDKEFLEKPCFTPDCDGVIAKIQTIDKKGDISKEFISDLKKEPKKQWAKWEKKIDIKERKKKKGLTSKSDNGIPENSCDSEKSSSRKNSDATEGSASSVESSVSMDSHAEKNIQLSENVPKVSQRGQEEEVLKKSEKLSEFVPNCSEQSEDCDVYSLHPDIPSSVVKASDSQSDLDKSVELCDVDIHLQDSQLLVSHCIKDNLYTYMADFLQHHGPLKIDDPLLLRELSTFPAEMSMLISESGGIAEFLREDIRFAYVGDVYICVVSDLATAYKMLNNSSLSSDIESFQSLENSNYSKFYNEYTSSVSFQNYSLNPDAVEYKPTVTSVTDDKNNNYNYFTNKSLSQNINNSNFSSKSFEPSPESFVDNSKNKNINSELSKFPENEVYSSKSKSCETGLHNKICSITESVFSAPTLDSEIKFNSEKPNRSALDKLEWKQKLPVEISSSDSKEVDDTSEESDKCSGDTSDQNVKSKEIPQTLSSIDNFKTNETNVGAMLLNALNLYFSEDMKSYRPSVDTLYIKPYIIKKTGNSASIGTVTDMGNIKNASVSDHSVQDTDPIYSICSASLKQEFNALEEQNMILQEQMNCATKQKQELQAEVSDLKKRLADSILDLEERKKEYAQKELQLQTNRKYLIESLTKAHETIDKYKKEIDMIKLQKNSLKKDIDDLILSLQSAEDSVKVQEKKYNTVIQNLQHENTELKTRERFLALQVLNLKKTEYLAKIEDKTLEASKRREEITQGLSMMYRSLNPMVQTAMKTFSTQLSTYVNELCTIKLDFLMKIDEQIEKVKNGASLREMEEIEMKELPKIPCLKDLCTASPSFDKYLFNSNTVPLSFGFNAPTVTPTAPVAPPVSIAPPIPSVPTVPSSLVINKKSKIDVKSETLDICNLNPDVQESFKSAMASINSYASAPLPNSVPSLDDDMFDKNFAIFDASASVSSNKAEPPKVPPGLEKPVASAATYASSLNPSKSPVETFTLKENKHFGGLDTIPKISTEQEKRKAMTTTTKNNYEKLLSKLQEQFPSYSLDELISFVKEFRMQRQGKLSGLPMDIIINQIGAIINSKKNPERKVSEQRNLTKANKVLVNKKLVPDSKPKDEQPVVKKKAAWGITGGDLNKQWTGNCDESCVICYEEMNYPSAYKVACGHTFHEECIRQWLKKKSDCPICRVHLLLPEDYPSLS